VERKQQPTEKLDSRHRYEEEAAQSRSDLFMSARHESARVDHLQPWCGVIEARLSGDGPLSGLDERRAAE
jgi:hypothetical protein